MDSLFWCEIDFSSCLAFSTAMLIRDWMWFIIWNMEAGLLTAPSSSFFNGLLTCQRKNLKNSHHGIYICDQKKKEKGFSHLLPPASTAFVDAVHVVIRPHLGFTNVRVGPATA